MIDLPPSMSRIHLLFHASMLKLCHTDNDYNIHSDVEIFDKELSYDEELITLLDKDIRNF